MLHSSSSCTFSSPEPRSFWLRQGSRALALTPEVRDSRTSVKSGKSDWLRVRKEYSAHAQKISTGQSSRSLPQVRMIVGSGDENASCSSGRRNVRFAVQNESEYVQPRPQGTLLSCAGNVGTPGQAQRHSGFEWLCKHNWLRPEPIRFVRLDSEHAQSDGKSVNRGLPELYLARGRDPCLLTKRIAASGNEIGVGC